MRKYSLSILQLETNIHELLVAIVKGVEIDGKIPKEIDDVEAKLSIVKGIVVDQDIPAVSEHVLVEW